MTDTTTARRHLLTVLLDRVERGALLNSERLLLRPLVTADREAADDEIADLQAQLDHTFRERDEWWNTATEKGETLGRRVERAEAAIARVRAQCADWAQLASPGDVGMTPDDTAFAEAGRIILAVLDGASPTPDDASPATERADPPAEPKVDVHVSITPQQVRDTLTLILNRLDRGETLTGNERYVLRHADAVACSRTSTRERTTR